METSQAEALVAQLKVIFTAKTDWVLCVDPARTTFGHLFLALESQKSGELIQLEDAFSVGQLFPNGVTLFAGSMEGAILDDADAALNTLAPLLNPALKRFQVTVRLYDADKDVVEALVQHVVDPSRVDGLCVYCLVAFGRHKTTFSDQEPLVALLPQPALDALTAAAQPTSQNRGNRRELFP